MYAYSAMMVSIYPKINVDYRMLIVVNLINQMGDVSVATVDSPLLTISVYS